MAPEVSPNILAEADQEIAHYTDRVKELIGHYLAMKVEGKDRTSATAVVFAGALMTGDLAALSAMLAVAVADLAEHPDRSVA